MTDANTTEDNPIEALTELARSDVARQGHNSAENDPVFREAVNELLDWMKKRDEINTKMRGIRAEQKKRGYKAGAIQKLVTELRMEEEDAINAQVDLFTVRRAYGKKTQEAVEEKIKEIGAEQNPIERAKKKAAK